MTPNQPYLLRGIHEWILDNDLTPHILVDANQEKVLVPLQFVQDGKIVLNIAPHAISNMLLDNEAVSFSARFSGVVESIYIPVHAIRAIYASENGQGMVFPEEQSEDTDIEQSNTEASEKTDESAKTKTSSSKKAPFLKVIK
jgi:stringent starvation protein B